MKSMLETKQDPGKTMAYRLIKGALKLIVALVVLAVLATGYLFYRAMPAYSGRAALAGLSADVHVWRDDYGIPHIFANDMNDAARASATCTPASGSIRCRCRAGSVRAASPRSSAPTWQASTNSCAPLDYIALPS